MKLVLLSGGQSRNNQKLHQAAVRLAKKGHRNSRSISLTYIPFCSEGSGIFYHRMVRRYEAHGVKHFFCLNVDNGPGDAEIRRAFQSDIIYLAGGNTFYFLKHLRESGVLPRLKKYASHGGVLAGLSAGALIMSPTVALAADKGLGPDENDVGLKDHEGINLFPFEFSPHFDHTLREIRAHVNYSKRTPNPVYAVRDGSGIVIEDQVTTIEGSAMLFHQGSITRFHR